MSQPTKEGVSVGKVAVIVAIVGAVAFGGYLGYLAYSNDSFPAQQRPFGNYASVVSYAFNGTELSYNVKWLNADYLPMFAQLTGDQDTVNTPVCGLGLQSVTSGQVLPLPFALAHPSPTVTNVQLSIAVRALSNGSEFTIVYIIPSASAQNAPISPSNVACRQTPGGM